MVRKMKKKILTIISVILILFAIFVGYTYGADICNLDVKLEPSIQQIKDELYVTVSVNNITKEILGVSFSLEYDKDIFEIEGDSCFEGWTSLPRIENSFTFFTSDYKASR